MQVSAYAETFTEMAQTHTRKSDDVPITKFGPTAMTAPTKIIVVQLKPAFAQYLLLLFSSPTPQQ